MQSLDRIILGAERRGIVDLNERRVVAYHEAGHALVAVFTPGADPVIKVTIIPRGRALGVTGQLPDSDRSNYSGRIWSGGCRFCWADVRPRASGWRH